MDSKCRFTTLAFLVNHGLSSARFMLVFATIQP